MIIGSIDTKTTSMWRRKSLTEERVQHLQDKEKKNVREIYEKAAFDMSVPPEDDEGNDEIDVDEEEELYVPPEGSRDEMCYNTRPLPCLARMCDRFGVSDNVGAALANAILKDHGLISKGNAANIIGPSKLRKERIRERKRIWQKEMESGREVSNVGFDGKRMATRILIKNENTGHWHPKVVVQDHYVLLTEPDSAYLGHVTPRDGSGKSIGMAIYDYLEKNNLLTSIISVSADGTNVNVGASQGAIRFLEMALGRPVHYCICQLHGNELPFRHLFYHYDGKPKGPDTWSGPIGRQMKEELASLPVVKFNAIHVNNFPKLASDILQDLSWDQKYLYRICTAIIAGKVSADLAALEPGPPCTSRWNTTWSRICRLYVATATPSYQLLRLTHIIVTFSAPMWFHIKCNPKAIQGSLNTFKTIQLLRHLNPEEKAIAKPVINRNSYFAHPDQILLSMITDDDKSIRNKAVKLISMHRSKPLDTNSGTELFTTDVDENGNEGDLDENGNDETDMSPDEDQDWTGVSLDHSVRQCRVPIIKWQAKTYHSMIDWSTMISEPPITSSLTEQQLDDIINTPFVVPRWLNHTQPVERGIKVLTEAAEAVTGAEARDGFIRQRLFSRHEIPKFKCKKDFYV